jgi:exosortase A
MQASIDSSIQGKQVPLVCDWGTASLVLAVTTAVVLALFGQTVGTLVQAWQSRTFSHGFLVLPAVVYLTWCYRDRLARLVPTPNRWGLPVLLVIGMIWLIAGLRDMLIVQQFAVVAMLPGLVWTTFGPSVTRALLYPLGFLFFALPVGTFLEPWLQDFTAAFVVPVLRLVGIPVYWEGNFLALPSKTWWVAPDCAGLRYLFSGMALGYLYTAMVYRRPLRRLGFLLVCLPVLIVANGLRVYGIIVTDYLGIAEGTDHRVFSYSIYFMTVFPLLWLGLRWRDTVHHNRTPGGFELWPTPLTMRDSYPRSSSLEMALTALCGIGLLAIAPLTTWLWGDLP